MGLLSRLLMMSFVLLIGTSSFAEILWYEPEVVPERLYRGNRKVLKFTGTTEPGTLIRIRDNRVKMFLDDGRWRWALLPQKNKAQFPLVVSDDGTFEFKLYLPTVPVEIPVQTKRGKRWVQYNLNFRVPESGYANDFSSEELSYLASSNRDSGYTPTVGEYVRENDQGQILPRLEDDRSTNPFAEVDLLIYAGLQASWMKLDQDTLGSGYEHSENDITFPAWSAGAVYRKNARWRFEGNIRAVNADFEPSGVPANLYQGGDTTWFELKLNATYYNWDLSDNKKLGIDFGLQYHSLPYFRTRTGVSNFAYFDNTVYALHAGARLESDRAKEWPWEVYARLVLPFSAGDAFSMNSGYGLDLGGGVDHRLINDIYVGGWARAESLFLDTSWDTINGSQTTDYNLTVVAVGGRFSVHF